MTRTARLLLLLPLSLSLVLVLGCSKRNPNAPAPAPVAQQTGPNEGPDKSKQIPNVPTPASGTQGSGPDQEIEPRVERPVEQKSLATKDAGRATRGAPNPNAPASAAGKVTYKGEPVTGGTLMFQGHGNYVASLDANGTYSTTDLPIGEMVVTVETASANTSKKVAGALAAKMSKMMSPMPESARSLPQGKYVKIPARYADPRTSSLKVTLKDGKNNINFELTD